MSNKKARLIRITDGVKVVPTPQIPISEKHFHDESLLGPETSSTWIGKDLFLVHNGGLDIERYNARKCMFQPYILDAFPNDKKDVNRLSGAEKLIASCGDKLIVAALRRDEIKKETDPGSHVYVYSTSSKELLKHHHDPTRIVYGLFCIELEND